MTTDIGDVSDDAELGLLDGNTGTNDILNRDRDGHRVQEQIGGTGSDEAETLNSVIEFLEIHLARNQQMDIQTNVRQSVFFFSKIHLGQYLSACLFVTRVCQIFLFEPFNHTAGPKTDITIECFRFAETMVNL